MARQKTRTLLTDWLRARCLRVPNGGGEGLIELASRSKAPHVRDHLFDRARRPFTSGARGRRRAVEPGSDPVLRDVPDVAHDACRGLDGHLLAGDLTRRAVFAASSLTRVLRGELPDPRAPIVCLERDANPVNLSEAEARDAVADDIRKERGP
ncbi:MAG: host attachment protein [Paracoccaceae bacterium]|jgi:hypothetical protein|nr:host attachment protein [Paracoccaceae bacterium]